MAKKKLKPKKFVDDLVKGLEDTLPAPKDVIDDSFGIIQGEYNKPGGPDLGVVAEARQNAQSAQQRAYEQARREQNKFTSGPFKSKAMNVVGKIGHGLSEGFKRYLQVARGTHIPSNLPNLRRAQEQRIAQQVESLRQANADVQQLGMAAQQQALAIKQFMQQQEFTHSQNVQAQAKSFGLPIKDDQGQDIPVQALEGMILGVQAVQHKMEADYKAKADELRAREEAIAAPVEMPEPKAQGNGPKPVPMPEPKRAPDAVDAEPVETPDPSRRVDPYGENENIQQEDMGRPASDKVQFAAAETLNMLQILADGAQRFNEMTPRPDLLILIRGQLSKAGATASQMEQFLGDPQVEHLLNMSAGE
jgi:hypothetical protein